MVKHEIRNWARESKLVVTTPNLNKQCKAYCLALPKNKQHGSHVCRRKRKSHRSSGGWLVILGGEN